MNGGVDAHSVRADKHRGIRCISSSSSDKSEGRSKRQHGHAHAHRRRPRLTHDSHSDKTRRHGHHHHRRRRGSRSEGEADRSLSAASRTSSSSSSFSSSSSHRHRRRHRRARGRTSSPKLTRAEALLRSESFTLIKNNDNKNNGHEHASQNTSGSSHDARRREAERDRCGGATVSSATPALVNEHRIRDRIYGSSAHVSSTTHVRGRGERHTRHQLKHRRRSISISSSSSSISISSNSSSFTNNSRSTHRSHDRLCSSEAGGRHARRPRGRHDAHRRGILNISSSDTSSSRAWSDEDEGATRLGGRGKWLTQSHGSNRSPPAPPLQPTMDWVCGVCSNLNSASRGGAQCFRCHVLYADSLSAVPSRTLRLRGLADSDSAAVALARLCGALQLHGECSEEVVVAARYDAHRRVLYVGFDALAQAIRAMVYCRCHVMLEKVSSAAAAVDATESMECANGSAEMQRCDMSFADDAKLTCETSVTAEVSVSGMRAPMQITRRSSCATPRTAAAAIHAGKDADNNNTRKEGEAADSLPAELHPDRWTPPRAFDSEAAEKAYLQRMTAHWARLSDSQKAHYDERVRQAWASKLARAAPTVTERSTSDGTCEASSANHSGSGGGGAEAKDSVQRAPAAVTVTTNLVTQTAAAATTTTTDKVALLKQRMAQRKAQMSSAAAVKSDVADEAEKGKGDTERNGVKSLGGSEENGADRGGAAGHRVFFLDGFPIPEDLAVARDVSDVSLLSICSSSSWRTSGVWTLSSDVAQRVLPRHLRPHLAR